MIIRRLTSAVALAVLFLGVSAGLRYAEGAGLVGGDDAKRALQVLIGLGLAAYANLMPKQLADSARSPRAEALTQAALRVGGWSFALAGLAYAGFWAFAPLPLADVGSMTVVLAAIAATLTYALRAFTACRSARPVAR